MKIGFWPKLSFLIALVASLGIHLTVAGIFSSEKVTKIEGAAPQHVLAFGNSFQDLVEGNNTPAAPPPDQAEPTVSEIIEPNTQISSAQTIDDRERTLKPVVEETKDISEPTAVVQVRPEPNVPQKPTLPTLTSVKPSEITPSSTTFEVTQQSEPTESVQSIPEPTKVSSAVIVQEGVEVSITKNASQSPIEQSLPAPKPDQKLPNELKKYAATTLLTETVLPVTKIEEQTIASLPKTEIPIPQFRIDLKDQTVEKQQSRMDIKPQPSPKVSSSQNTPSKTVKNKVPVRKKPTKKVTETRKKLSGRFKLPAEVMRNRIPKPGKAPAKRPASLQIIAVLTTNQKKLATLPHQTIPERSRER